MRPTFVNPPTNANVTSAKSSRASQIALAVALLTAATAIVANILTLVQLRISTEQARTANETYSQSLKVEDLRFVGKLAVAVAGDTIRISNESDLPAAKVGRTEDDIKEEDMQDGQELQTEETAEHELPSSGDVPIRDEDAEKILEVLETCVFPLHTLLPAKALSSAVLTRKGY